MKSKEFLLSGVAAFTISLTTTLALAVSTISLDPATSTGSVGGTIFVDLLWDGDGANYIGDFDVDILYDDSIVSYIGAVIDPDFGVDSFGCFICGDGSTPGTVDLFEVSFDSVPDLIANQDSLGNMFRLAILEFKGLADGHTTLSLSGTFGNEFGLDFTHNLANGEIWIETPGTPTIPEPSTMLLLGTGLAGLAAWRFRRQQAG